MVEEVSAAFLWNNLVSAQRFFADHVCMKSHLLDGMLRFLKHALPLEILGPKLRVFYQFPLLGERGVLA